MGIFNQAVHILNSSKTLHLKACRLMLFVAIAFLTQLHFNVAYAQSASESDSETKYSKLVEKSSMGRITKINISGVSEIKKSDIDSASQLSIGQIYSEIDIAKSQKSITEYLKRRGFYKANVQSSITSLDDRSVQINFAIEEGVPCRIVKLDIEDPPQFSSKNAFLKFKARMSEVLQVIIGDVYDEESLSDRLRNLREWLVSEDFILANTENVKLEYFKDYTEVSIFISATYGDRVTFGFVGNDYFSKGELNEFISEVRTTGLGKDYVGVIKRKFIEEYKKNTYNSAQIAISVSERESRKHVTFNISENLRAKINSIHWEGLSDRNVERAETVFKGSISRYTQRGYFVEKDVDKGVELILEDLKSRGYLVSKLLSKTVRPVRIDDTRVNYYDINVLFSEGEQTLISRIDLKGNTYLSSEEVKDTLKIREGEVFNPFALEEGMQILRAKYISQGFLDFKILTDDSQIVSFAQNGRTSKILLYIDEGARIRIDEIRIQGLAKTRPFVVEREYNFIPGDYWISEQISETESNLRKLGIFSEVRIKPESSPKGIAFRNMLIDIKESDPGQFEMGPGFRSDLGLRTFSRLSYNNVRGRNWIATVGAEGNRRLNNQYRFIEYRFDAGLIIPRFNDSKFLYSVGASASKQRFPPDFNATTTKFTTGFERKFLKNNSLTAKLFYKIERIRQFDVYINGIYSVLDNATLLIGSLNPSVSYDTRDSPFITTRGQVTSLSLELSDPAFALQTAEDTFSTGYSRWSGGTHWYFPVTKDIVWSNVFAGGYERSNIQNRSIPLIKLFRLGGWSSIRGYTEDSINVDDISLKGTLTYLNLRTQMDFPLVGDLKLCPFLDAGNLYVDSFSSSPFFRAGSGAGLHYMTPIGPINLDYGVNLNPRPQDDTSRIHFSVGFI